MKKTNHSPESDNDWKIEPVEADSGEMFNMEAMYAPAEFLRIVRIIINRYLDDKSLLPMTQVLDIWEKRVLDYLNSYDGAEDDVLIGFNMGSDNITRIYFTLKADTR